MTELRTKTTKPSEFRRLVRTLAILLAQEALADLKTCEEQIETPLGFCRGEKLAGSVWLAPILRAGLGMVDGVLELLPEAEVRHLGLIRDEQTLEPHEYYSRLPARSRASLVLVLDPMLATGGSASRACHILRKTGVNRIKVVTLIAAPEGIERMGYEQPDVDIHVGAVDERLTSNGFIYPGLGDAGDRLFATFPEEEPASTS